ncbi:DUF5665 domain-containing protein [Paenibacillaceae bacterium WGS1546]|uniref:DUF5665 domain-containing protein n=1 Tax=Cohnella sp. WGS1546 TaxID=3366810 RepID=UPI00372D415D
MEGKDRLKGRAAMGGNSGNRHNGKSNPIKVKLDPNGPAESADRLAEEAKELKGTLVYLSEKLEKLSMDMEKAQLREYVELTHRPWKLMMRNLLSGLFRGIGIAIGFTFFAATIVYLLQMLGALNLPIVGDYIADVVRIVQRQLEINPY